MFFGVVHYNIDPTKGRCLREEQWHMTPVAMFEASREGARRYAKERT
jgi:hypothetical protein